MKKISKQQGSIIKTKFGKAELKWNPGFQEKFQSEIDNAQKYVDNEVISLMAPYTPHQSGMLGYSATLGTVIGSGEIKQVAPYAQYLYYGKLMVDPITGKGAFKDAEGRMWSRPGVSKELTDIDLNYNTSDHPQAGPFWFERMKADHKQDILEGTQEFLNKNRKE